MRGRGRSARPRRRLCNTSRLDVTYSSHDLGSNRQSSSTVGENLKIYQSHNDQPEIDDFSDSQSISPSPNTNDESISPIIGCKKKPRMEISKVKELEGSYSISSKKKKETVLNSKKLNVSNYYKYDTSAFDDGLNYEIEEVPSPLSERQDIAQCSTKRTEDKQRLRKTLFPANITENNKAQSSPISIVDCSSSQTLSAECSKEASDLSAKIKSISSSDISQNNNEEMLILSLSSETKVENKTDNLKTLSVSDGSIDPSIKCSTAENDELILTRKDAPIFPSPEKRNKRKPPPKSLSDRLLKLMRRPRSDLVFWNHEKYMAKHGNFSLSHIKDDDVILLKIIASRNECGLYMITCENICNNPILHFMDYTVIMHRHLVETMTTRIGWNLRILKPFKVFENGNTINLIVNVYKYEVLKPD